MRAGVESAQVAMLTFDLSAIISQLRSVAASRAFFKLVGGTLDYETFKTSGTNAQTPAAFVLPGGVEGGEFPPQTGFRQHIVSAFSVVVVFDSTADRRGQSSANQVPLARQALWRALLNWNPNPSIAAYPVYHGDDELLESNGARTYWQFTFQQAQTVTDGYDAVFAYEDEPLETLHLDTYEPGPITEDEDPLVQGQVQLPQ